MLLAGVPRADQNADGGMFAVSLSTPHFFHLSYSFGSLILYSSSESLTRLISGLKVTSPLGSHPVPWPSLGDVRVQCFIKHPRCYPRKMTPLVSFYVLHLFLRLARRTSRDGPHLR
jgi:hypothetical protein